MKTINIALRARPNLTSYAALCLAGLLCFISHPAAAANRTKSKPSVLSPRVKNAAVPSRPTRTKPAASESVVITGSLLAQRIGPDGTLPVTSSAVSVLTSKDITRLGAANLAQALRRGIAGSR